MEQNWFYRESVATSLTGMGEEGLQKCSYLRAVINSNHFLGEASHQQIYMYIYICVCVRGQNLPELKERYTKENFEYLSVGDFIVLAAFLAS